MDDKSDGNTLMGTITMQLLDLKGEILRKADRQQLIGATIALDSAHALVFRGLRIPGSYQKLQWVPDDEQTYRVWFKPNGSIEVVCIGLIAVDANYEGVYGSAEELPTWVQERVAVLSMMSSEPPTTFVEGVGQRIDKDVYWVIKLT